MLKKLFSDRKYIYIIAGILCVLCLCMAIIASTRDTAQTAKNGDTVQVDYTLMLSDGSVYETSVGGTPLEFVIGAGTLLPDFEEAVIGMKVGESKNISIPASSAYGLYRDDLVFTIDRTELAEGLDPKVGDHLQSIDSSGQTWEFVVIAAGDTTLTLDANHPLAGQDLTFKIDLLKIN
jgi:FKBP-type peptidyl-prolyl cis-trans isomerase 2